MHCVKSIRIRSYSGPHIWSFILHISPYSVRMRENADQNNSKYVHFLRSDLIMILWNIINFLDRVSSKTRGIQITKLLLPILRKGKKWSEELQVFTSWKRLEVFIKKQKKKTNKKEHCVKNVLIWSYSGPHFPAFRLNTERHSVSVCIQCECGKMRVRITPNTDTFHSVKKIWLTVN